MAQAFIRWRYATRRPGFCIFWNFPHARCTKRRGFSSIMAHGRFQTASPGPTTVPEHVLNAMNRDTVNYVASLQSGKQICDDLRCLAGTRQHVKICAGNGHLGWQMALANTLEAGDSVLVMDSKGFGHLWGMVAKSMGITVNALSPRVLHERIDLAALEQCLREDTTRQIKAVVALHTESDFTVHYDIPEIREAIDAAQHPALLMVDTVATFGCAPFEMDAWGVDVMVSASQKETSHVSTWAFHPMHQRQGSAMSSKQGIWTPGENIPWVSVGTPATHLLMGLQTSLDMILRQHGLQQTFERHRTFARAVWAAVDAWGKGTCIRCFVPEINHRSPVVTLVKAEGVNAMEVRQWCHKEANLLLPGAGLGFLFPDGQGTFQEGFEGHDAFRIGHMGYCNPSMLLGTLATIDCAFKALNIQHGHGAVDAAATVIASRWSELNSR